MEPAVGVRGIVTSQDLDDGTLERVYELAHEFSRAAGRINVLSRRFPSRSSVQALAAVQALGLASTALFAAVDAQCDLDQPPTSLDTRPRGADHKLITRCQHDPPHCWEGTVFIDCPAP